MQKSLRPYFFFFFSFLSWLRIDAANLEDKPLNILHLTFHKGCANEFNDVAKVFGYNVETWWIPELLPYSFDGVSKGNVLYNIGHDRAKRIWDLHKDTFEKFDVIVTSDTAPLSRIFLQNGWQKPLIVWVCCRFDYSDRESIDCDFPDQEYYRLFNEAKYQDNVAIVAYTQFEQYYAKTKGVDLGNLLITPCAPLKRELGVSAIPSSIDKATTFFLPPYSNEINRNYSQLCSRLRIPNYCGRYSGPADLKDFKGIIHFPYAWSNLAFFENIAYGIPYFVPSRSFLKKLMKPGDYWHTEPWCLLRDNRFDLSEWYKPGREEIITYFDSWEDLKVKIEAADYPALREKIAHYADQYRETMLDRWAQVFNKVLQSQE
jgi:hypothetical protein